MTAHAIRTDGIYWFVDCVHPANDPSWYCRHEGGGVSDRKCWVSTWTDHNWGDTLGQSINNGKVEPLAVVGVELMPDEEDHVRVLSTRDPRLANGNDHVLVTDGCNYSAVCLHGETYSDGEPYRSMVNGHCCTVDDDGDFVPLGDYLYGFTSHGYTLGYVHIVYGGPDIGPEIESFTPDWTCGAFEQEPCISSVADYFGRSPRAQTFHPGVYLQEELEARGWTPMRFAGLAHISPAEVQDILDQKAGITLDVAFKLERVLEVTAETWLNMQTLWDCADYRAHNDEAP